MTQVLAPDLTRRAPRSLRVRLGGYAILPRLLDKWRADLAGKVGEYHVDCPLDRQFLGFTGIAAADLRAELAHGRTDGEMLDWVGKNATQRHAEWAIEAWSDAQEKRQPTSDAGTLAYFAGEVAKLNPSRQDIRSWADLLDLDDHVSFGGTA